MRISSSRIGRLLVTSYISLSPAAGGIIPNVLDTTAHDGSLNAINSSKTPSEVLAIPLRRIEHRGVGTTSIARRYFKTDVLGVYGAAYLAELTVGTNNPPQKVEVLIDTGSFELWVNPDCAASNVPEFCNAFGQYDPTRSSSAQSLNRSFDIAYGSGNVSGTYYKDDVYISGAKIQSQQFGVANRSDLVWLGIMGLGHGQGEGEGKGKGFIDYPLIVDSLAAQGYTNSKLFSLDLGGQVSPGTAITGEVVFGGVDTNKYSGYLDKVATDPTDPHYAVVLHSLSHRRPDSNDPKPFIDANLPLRMIIDSGTSLSLFPASVVRQMAAQFPGASPDGSGGYRVPCSLRDQPGTVDFEFSAGTGTDRTVTISVSYRDFVWNSGRDCFLGAWSDDSIGVWILGDTFLRAAYVTFDQANDAVYMANYMSCNGGAANLVPVPAGPDVAAEILGSCPKVVATPPQSSSSSSSPTSASVTLGLSSTAIESAVASLGPSLNPVGRPVDASSVSLTSASSVLPTSSTARIAASPFVTLTTDITKTSTPTPSNSEVFDNGNADGGTSVLATTAINAETSLDASVTITRTLTRTVIYTVSSCRSSLDTDADCAVGRIATRFELVTTTFCAPRYAATTTTTTTTTTTKTPLGGSSVIEAAASAAPTILVPAPAPRLATTTITTKHCTTSTYAVTSCDPLDEGTCTVGMMTAEVLTVLATVVAVETFGAPTVPPSLSTARAPTPDISVVLPQDDAEEAEAAPSAPQPNGVVGPVLGMDAVTPADTNGPVLVSLAANNRNGGRSVHDMMVLICSVLAIRFVHVFLRV